MHIYQHNTTVLVWKADVDFSLLSLASEIYMFLWLRCWNTQAKVYWRCCSYWRRCSGSVQLDHVAWTQNQKVWGTIPIACHEYKCWVNFSLPGKSWLSGSSCLHTCMICALYSPRGDEIAQVVCVLYQGRQQVGWIWYRYQTLIKYQTFACWRRCRMVLYNDILYSHVSKKTQFDWVLCMLNFTTNSLNETYFKCKPGYVLN